MRISEQSGRSSRKLSNLENLKIIHYSCLKVLTGWVLGRAIGWGDVAEDGYF